jgi:hypothetical protein
VISSSTFSIHATRKQGTRILTFLLNACKVVGTFGIGRAFRPCRSSAVNFR